MPDHAGPPSDEGRPFPELFPPTGRAAPDRADIQTVTAQVGFLGPVEDVDWQISQLELLRRRRRTRQDPAPGAPLDPFELPLHSVPDTDKVVLTTAHLLVRTADWQSVEFDKVSELQRILSGFGRFTPQPATVSRRQIPPTAPQRPAGAAAADDAGPADPAAPADPTTPPEPPPPFDEFGARVLRLAPERPLDLGRLPDVLKAVRYADIPISLDHIVPLNVVLKSKSAIRATTASVPFPPSWIRPGEPVVVAVVDTGVNVTHRTDGWLDNTEDDENTDPLDAFPLAPDGPDHLLDYSAGHGTFVAGIVALVSPTTTVRVYRAVDSDGIGSEVTVGQAIVRAAREGAAVINLSLGTDTADGVAPLGLAEAFAILRESYPDVLVVAAAGNSGLTDPTWPSAFPGVVSVAALRADLQPAAWSNHGERVTLWTVGEGVLSTFVPGTEPSDPETGSGSTFDDAHLWGLGSGTSFAAPQIAGAVARLLQDPDRAALDPPVSSPRTAVDYLLAHSFPVPDQTTVDGVSTPITGRGVVLLPGTETR